MDLNDEINEKLINLAVRVGRLAAAEFKKALETLITELEKDLTRAITPGLKHGKQTLRRLQKHNDGLSTMELKNPELRRLYREMRKDNIDFAAVRDGKGAYTLFFKGKDADVLAHAFKRYTEKVVKTADKKSVRT